MPDKKFAFRDFVLYNKGMEKFQTLCIAIRESIPAEYKWEWDNRFTTPLICLKLQDSLQVKEKISAIFNKMVDSTSLKKAASGEKELAKSLGGLKNGQILFISGSADNLLFGAWWPWGDGKHVSLRLGIHLGGADAAAVQQAVLQIRSWFNLS